MKGNDIPRQVPLLAAIVALAFTLLPLRAATIVWGSPMDITGDADVSTSGDFLYGYTFGNVLVPEVTVNDVIFAPFPVPNDNLTTRKTEGDVTLETDGDFYSDNTAAGSAVPPFSDLSDDYKTLLRSQVSDKDDDSILTLTMGGLQIGQEYQVQVWSNDSGALFNRWGGTIYSAGNDVTLDNSVENGLGGTGQWVTGSFTANATTQVVTISSSTFSGDFPVINAMQVRVVPEPSSALLLLSGVALLQRRSRGKKAEGRRHFGRSAAEPKG